LVEERLGLWKVNIQASDPPEYGVGHPLISWPLKLEGGVMFNRLPSG